MNSRLVAIIVGAFLGLASLAGTAWWFARDVAPQPLYAAYTIVAPTSVAESQVVARALIRAEDDCPPVRTNGENGFLEIEMTPRLPGPNAAPAFSQIVACSASLPLGINSASINGKSIPAAMPSSVEKIAMFADSGCRMDEYRIQDCNNADKWPLAQIAGRIAAEQPDLIVNPGDYVYREIRCPEKFTNECGGTIGPMEGFPFSETDLGWIQEFFDPAAALFPVAPIAFLRGNHEDCGRGGNGWFLYLDPFPGTETTCDPYITDEGLEAAVPQTTPAWSFDAPIANGRILRLAMVDSAYGSDKSLTPWIEKQRVIYQQADSLTRPTQAVESWLVTHRPLFARISTTLMPKDDPLAEPWTSDGQMIAAYGLLGNYDMILASHNHYAQVNQIPGQPAATIIGNGGALLEPKTGYEPPTYGPLTNGDGTPMVPGLAPYPNASFQWTNVEYGYAIARPNSTRGSWTIAHFNYDGNLAATCGLAQRQISCIE
jgi:hypothetical protein